ncbi:flagellar assembly peptidoglycan hydrolase FlgJ [Billgrantia azerbaijanica]|nr:flagellar assembly peptidoglycan hydrolase FlgJ [Halomonas azerbaijanica]
MSLDTSVSGQFALDVQGLERLKRTSREDADAGLSGASRQFEALLLQHMLKSMREAMPSGGLLDSQQGEFYQSLMDQQWAQTLAGRGVGLADHLVAQLQAQGVGASQPAAGDDAATLIAGIPRGAPRVLENALQPSTAASDANSGESDRLPTTFLDALETQRGDFMGAVQARVAEEQITRGATVSAESGRQGDVSHVERFVERLAEPARVASRRTGVPAELILAQAALETGWGRHEIPTANGGNSHNLFGIKAGSGWHGQTTEITTHEYVAGRRIRVTDTFRVYDSFAEAFTDYARLIGDNPRYAGVVQAGSAEQAARALQAGGYATDPAYADKLVAIMGRLRDTAGDTLASADSLHLAQSLYQGRE